MTCTMSVYHKTYHSVKGHNVLCVCVSYVLDLINGQIVIESRGIINSFWGWEGARGSPEYILERVHTPCIGIMSNTVLTVCSGALSVCTIFCGENVWFEFVEKT